MSNFIIHLPSVITKTKHAYTEEIYARIRSNSAEELKTGDKISKEKSRTRSASLVLFPPPDRCSACDHLARVSVSLNWKSLNRGGGKEGGGSCGTNRVKSKICLPSRSCFNLNSLSRIKKKKGSFI